MSQKRGSPINREITEFREDYDLYYAEIAKILGERSPGYIQTLASGRNVSDQKKQKILKAIEKYRKNNIPKRPLSPNEISAFLSLQLKTKGRGRANTDFKPIFQADLARIIGSTRPTINYYLAGRNLEKKDTRQKVLDAFNICVEEYAYFNELQALQSQDITSACREKVKSRYNFS